MLKAILSIFVLSLAPTCAATIFTGSAAFNAAIAGFTQTTEDYSSGVVALQTISNGETINGVTYDFSLVAPATQGIVDNQFNSFTGLSLGVDRTAIDPFLTFFFGADGDTVTLTFAQPILAFGVFFNANPNTGLYGFTTGIDNAFSDSAAYDTNTFVFAGLLADAPFSSVTLSGASSFNVPAFIMANPVPEPTTFALIGAGVATLAFFRRR